MAAATEREKAAMRARYAADPKGNMARAAAWAKANPEKRRMQVRRWRCKRRGITLEGWQDLFDSQGGCCAICRQPLLEQQKAHLDHNHVTGAVRGILCQPCNVGLGVFKDDPARLLAARDYLCRGV